VLLAGEHPGAKFRGDCIVRIDALLDSGVRQFVNLTDFLEGPGPYVPILREGAWSRELEIAYYRFAIPDFGVPSAALMRSALDAIYGAIDARETIYLHCWGASGGPAPSSAACCASRATRPKRRSTSSSASGA
jgi:hypothetical protein